MNKSLDQNETLLGMVGTDFAMMMVDTSMPHPGLVPNDNYTKYRVLTPFLAVGYIGNPGPAKVFYNFVAAKQSYHFIHDKNYLRPEVIVQQSDRGRPEEVVGYVFPVRWETGPELHFIDNLGSHQKVESGTHGLGLGGYIGKIILDGVITTEFTENQALEMMKMAAAEINILSPGPEKKFRVDVVDKNGVRHLPDIL